jgi:hypothetical protein
MSMQAGGLAAQGEGFALEIGLLFRRFGVER